MSLEMQAGIKEDKYHAKRKKKKMFKKRESDLARMRRSAVLAVNEDSKKWIYTAEQVESQITLAKLRPYYPSFMWKPIDPTPTRLLDLLEAEAKEGLMPKPGHANT